MLRRAISQMDMHLSTDLRSLFTASGVHLSYNSPCPPDLFKRLSHHMSIMNNLWPANMHHRLRRKRNHNRCISHRTINHSWSHLHRRMLVRRMHRQRPRAPCPSPSRNTTPPLQLRTRLLQLRTRPLHLPSPVRLQLQPCRPLNQLPFPFLPRSHHLHPLPPPSSHSHL